jgi:hypothetical protein
MSNCRKPQNYEEINTNLKKSMIKKERKNCKDRNSKLKNASMLKTQK